MVQLKSIAFGLAGLGAVQALPIYDSPTSGCDVANTTCGPIPGESEVYNNYTGKAAPFPGNITRPINATAQGDPGADDLLFQNLLSAEWIIYSFYQAAVEAFNASSFTEMGLPDNTYERITEIRDNEAGHLRIFQDSISATSLKPGPCEYEFGLSSAGVFLALQQLIEISSEAFLTGLVLQAKLDATKGALVAIGEIESRHSSWALVDVWGGDPFTGPAETVFPYANLILDLTNEFVVPGTCPPENPPYPRPDQHLPQTSFLRNSTTARPGSDITFTFSADPHFREGTEYYAVFYHGVQKVSVPFDTATNRTTIPAAFDSKGLIIAVVADTPGAPYIDTVVSNPLTILQQPSQITLSFGV